MIDSIVNDSLVWWWFELMLLFNEVWMKFNRQSNRQSLAQREKVSCHKTVT